MGWKKIVAIIAIVFTFSGCSITYDGAKTAYKDAKTVYRDAKVLHKDVTGVECTYRY